MDIREQISLKVQLHHIKNVLADLVTRPYPADMYLLTSELSYVQLVI
jgi:hypothetical protein